MRSFSESYRDAGVNIEAGYEGVKLMKKHVQRTMIPGVVSDIGGFGGLFAPDLTGMSEPVLVSGKSPIAGFTVSTRWPWTTCWSEAAQSFRCVWSAQIGF